MLKTMLRISCILSRWGFIHIETMCGYSKLTSANREYIDIDRLLSGCRRNLSAERSVYIDNALRSILSVKNDREKNVIIRPRAFSEPAIPDICDIASPHVSAKYLSARSLNNVSNKNQRETLTQIQTEFIRNPHKSEPALKLFNEIALENLPESVKNIRCDVGGENLKTFIGIIASQKDKFSAHEKNEFEKICKKFIESGGNQKKQEKVYGLMRGLLANHGESALNSHYSYFIGFCICAWQSYHQLTHQNYNGDQIFKQSIHACKENIDRYINKLVNSRGLEDVAICKAAEEFKSNTIAIPLTLKFRNSAGSNNQDVEQNSAVNSEPSVSQEPESNFVTGESDHPVKLLREKKKMVIFIYISQLKI